MVHLWRGFHSPKLVELLRAAWVKKELVILLPPTAKSFSFASLFEPDRFVFHGEWPEEIKSLLLSVDNNPPKSAEKLKDARLGVFTSGTSTGHPRLIFYSEENIQSSLRSIRELFDVNKIEKIFSYPQPTHAFGLVLGYMQAILGNHKIYFSDGPYSSKAHEQWLSIVDQKTLTLGTPTHFLDLLYKVKNEGLTPKKSYSAIIGGARVTQELWSQVQEKLNIAEPSVGYGASEASPGITHLAPGVKPQGDGDIGSVLNSVKMDLRDEGLIFSGPNLCLAVYENDQLKQFNEILIKDYLVETKAPDKNRYSFLGRTDLLINRGGAKYSLEVIEGKLSSQFNCKCLAVSVFDERLGEDVGVLFQVDNNLDPEKLISDMQTYLATELGLKLSKENMAPGEIPLNANGKFDRKKALTKILKKKKLKFPLSVEYLKAFMPHRGSAIWVDSLMETRADFGVAKVVLKEGGNYFSPNGLRESACVEWTAQAYGYVVAINDILEIKHAEQVTKTFIAEVKNTQFPMHDKNIKFKAGDEIKIEVSCTHDFGLLKVVNGKIFYQEQLLGSVGMKVYCGN